MRYTLILAAMLATSAQAQTIGVHTFSKHSVNTFDYVYADGHRRTVAMNERNLGGYVIFDNGLIVGGYHNSYWEPTFYAGYTHNFANFGPITPSLTAAIATGYEKIYGVGKLRPMLMPSLIAKTPLGVSLRYSAAPAKGGLFQHLSVERKF
jgi:hypothetical protein